MSGASTQRTLSFGIEKCARPLVAVGETATAIFTVDVWNLGGVGSFAKLGIQIYFKLHLSFETNKLGI